MSSTTAASFNPSSSSSSSSPASTTSASSNNSSSSDAATAVTVYRDCVRGVKRVEGIKRQQLAAGVDVGVVSGAGLSLLLSPRHIEFALVIDARCLPSSSTSSTSTASSAEPKWLGFSYFGYLENLKRCFRKTHDDLLSYAKIIHENLTTQFSDPYASPLLFVGDSYEKAFWQISSPEAPHSVVGFIPFRPVSLFHSLKSHPIIAMEGGNYPIFTMLSGIDRHRLRAVSPELEARYQQTVQTATTLVSPHKLSHLQVHSVLSSKRPPANAANGKKKAGGSHDDSPKYSGEVVRKLVDDFYKHYASKSEDKKGLQPILVSGLVLASGSVTREVELVTLSMASMGKTHLMQAAQLLAPPTPTTGGSKALKDNLPDADRLAKELDHYQKRLEQLKLLLAQEPRIAIYNPFLSAANTVVLPTPAPTSSDASPVHQSPPPQHAHQPPQQQFDMSTQTMTSNQGASLLTASLQQRQPHAVSTRHSSSQYRGDDEPSIDFPSPAIDDASNGNGGRQPSPVPSLRAPSSYLPALSSSTATLATPTSASTSPSVPLHSSGGSGISNAGSGSMTPSSSHRLAGSSSSSRPTTPSSANGGTPRPFLRLSASQPAQDFTHGQDMSVLYRRLIELLYVSHPIPGGSYAPVLSSPFAHQHASPSLRTSTTPPTSMGSSSTSLPVRRFFAPTAPANTPLSLSRSSSGFIRRSASPSTITFLSSAAPGFPAPSTSSSWKRFPRVTSSPAIAFPTPGGSGPVDYADFITPEQLLASSGSAHAPSFGRQGDVALRSSASPPVHRQPSPASPPAQPVLESFQHPQHPHQPHAYPPQAYHHHQPQPTQRSSPVPLVPVAVQPSPSAPAQPLPEHHPHAPSNAAPVPAPARALRLSQSQAPHHPRMPEAHFAHPQQPGPSLRVSTGGLAPPAAEVHPNESASDFLLRLIGGNKDASQHDEDRHQSAQEGANGLPEPAHIDRGILAYSVAAALAKHQQQHQQQHGGIHAH